MSELSARDGMIMGALDGAECVARLGVGPYLTPPVDPSRPEQVPGATVTAVPASPQ